MSQPADRDTVSRFIGELPLWLKALVFAGLVVCLVKGLDALEGSRVPGQQSVMAHDNTPSGRSGGSAQGDAALRAPTPTISEGSTNAPAAPMVIPVAQGAKSVCMPKEEGASACTKRDFDYCQDGADTSMAGIGNCVGVALNDANGRMQYSLEKASKLGNAQQHKLLMASQRSWEHYRADECAAKELDGAGATFSYVGCMLDMTYARMVDLESDFFDQYG